MSRLNRATLLGGIAGAAVSSVVPRTVRAADRPLIALVHTQAAGDNGVVDGMIVSFRRIAAERDLTGRIVYASDPANYQPILELLGEAGAAVVITTFEEMTEPLRAVAPAFPATRFVQLYGDPMVPVISNVRTVSYDTYLAGYLTGMCGAMMSSSNHIGYIGGTNLPTLDANVNAMIAGARSVRATMNVSTTWVGSFQDPGKALEIATQMFAGDVTYVQAEAAASDQGTIQAANRRPGRIVSAGSRPAFALGPSSVAAMTQCDFGVSLYGQTSAALGSGWSGGHYRSGLADGVVDFVPSPLFLAHGPPAEVARFRAAWPAIAASRTRIAAGSLKVPFKTMLG
jgi:basic membrane protein A